MDAPPDPWLLLAAALALVSLAVLLLGALP